MKNVRLGSFLLVITIVLAVIAVWNIYRYFLFNYHLQNLDRRVAAMERTRLSLQGLAQEATAYSRTNPAIDPLLVSFNVKMKPTNGTEAAVQPSAK
jgi:hypothetical protein